MKAMSPPAPAQQLPLLDEPEQPAASLEQQMRRYFDARWSRWHPARTYDRAVQDPITCRLLELTVRHLPRSKPRPPRN